MYKSSKELATELGLSKERVNQFGKVIGVQKVGNMYCWTDAEIGFLKSRIGKAGSKLGQIEKEKGAE